MSMYQSGRNIDHGKQESELAINIRKATSIGTHHSLSTSIATQLTSSIRGDSAKEYEHIPPMTSALLTHMQENMSERVSFIPGTTSPHNPFGLA